MKEYIKFIDKGVYQIVKEIPEIELDNYKWKGERMVANILRDLLHFEDSHILLTGKESKKLKKIFKDQDKIMENFGFICQATFDNMIWRGSLRFDFYFEVIDINGNKARCAIEFHGKQHDKPIKIFGGIDGYVTTVARDICKARYAYANNIFVLYIRSMKYEEVYNTIDQWITLIKNGGTPEITEYDVETLIEDEE